MNATENPQTSDGKELIAIGNNIQDLITKKINAERMDYKLEQNMEIKNSIFITLECAKPPIFQVMCI